MLIEYSHTVNITYAWSCCANNLLFLLQLKSSLTWGQRNKKKFGAQPRVMGVYQLRRPALSPLHRQLFFHR